MLLRYHAPLLRAAFTMLGASILVRNLVRDTASISIADTAPHAPRHELASERRDGAISASIYS